MRDFNPQLLKPRGANQGFHISMSPTNDSPRLMYREPIESSFMDPCNQTSERVDLLRRRFSFFRTGSFRKLFLALSLVAVFVSLIGCANLQRLSLPGKKTILDVDIQRVRGHLKSGITKLAGSNWRRHSYDTNHGLHLAANYIDRQFKEIGYPVVREEVLAKGDDYLLQSFNSPTIRMVPRPAFNLIAEKTGSAPEAGIIILGAHYDTMVFSTDWEGLKHEQFRPDVAGTPGADDNASGVAALIAIARELKGVNLKRTIRFCAFANEEPPFFQQPDAMGSWAYAAAQKERAKTDPREKVLVMISLETMAVYTEQTNNPKRGFVRNAAANIMGLSKSPDYIAFMSNWRGLSTSSGRVAKEWARIFSDKSSVPVRCVSLPFFSGEYFAWSDDWSFTRNGFNAFTVTDTAAYRSSRYHEGWDDLSHLTEHDYNEYAKVVLGLAETIRHFANE